MIDPEYAIGVMDYAHRISGWSLLQWGITRKRLPPLPRADQLTRLVDGRKSFAWQARPTSSGRTCWRRCGGRGLPPNDGSVRLRTRRKRLWRELLGDLRGMLHK